MKMIKNISVIFIISFLFSGMVNAQIGKTKIILSSGDTTLLVNPISKGMKGEDAKFLNKDKRYNDQQVFIDMKSEYQSLEEAAFDTNQLLEKIVKDQSETADVNSSLSYRATQVNRMKDAKEKQVQNILDSMLTTNAPLENVAAKYAEFGNKPTFYINGQQVAPSVPDLLQISDVLTRLVKVTNVISGNPNGEVWLTVTPKAYNHLKQLGYIKEESE